MADRAEFRFFEEADIDRVMEMVAEYSLELSDVAMSREKQREYRRYLRDILARKDHFLLLLEVDTTICGFIDYRTEICMQDHRMLFGEIREFYMVPPRRRRGLGRQLARRAVEHMRSLGADLVNLSVLMTNRTGEKFWNSLGFRNHCIRKRLYL